MRSEVYRLPELFLDRLRKIIPPQKWDAAANTFADPKPTTFRINTLKTSSKIVCEQLEREGFRLERAGFYSEAFILRKSRQRDLEEMDVYRKGEIYVQSLSSMIPPLMLEPQPREFVLDLTAAPGGKTTQLSCLMNGEGKILANESNRIRYDKLKANIERQSARNVELRLGYGESIGNQYSEKFDRILLDAPCTAEGRFFAREPASYRYWSLQKVREAAKLQKKLLLSALKALKPGGFLVYSTCTFAPEENEGVLNDAIERFGDGIGLVGAIHELPLRSIPNQMPGLSQWESKKFHPSIKKTKRILPTHEMEGFFIARIKKR